MLISPLCRALALHEIFDRRGIAPRGGLQLAEVEQAWAGFGLRSADLHEALSVARAAGEFTLSRGQEGDEVVLTELGYEYAQRDPSNLAEIDALVQAYAMLDLARQRPREGIAFGRRKSDRR